jgi:FlaA1/EpsC-like NDP-sugar epimerase
MLVKEQIDQVIVAMFTVSRETIHRITTICNEKKVRMRIIPGYYEVISGNVSTSRIREVNIEDLLGRDPVTLDEPGLARFISGKCVLITGAGGSIGSELARQVARLGPSRLLLLERAENAMYEIHRELRSLRTDIVMHALVADVADEMRMKKIFDRYHPAIVIHAAAHKHVPMMEMNPGEAIKNNTLASRRLGEMALDAGVECMVLISTDKAVNPTSVMGASKRLAELALQDLNGRGKTRFVAVRFGNVLGSAGSVVPLFREQIKAGGPVTVTHPDMVRYFMTIPEAVGLVLQAAVIADGGEVFILDMGEPVKIVDLAEDMIRLSGFKPNEEISIVFSGIRPGEKLFEELGTSPEHVNKTSHPRIMIAKIPTLGRNKTEGFLKVLSELCMSEADDSQIRKAIAKAIPEASIKTDV